MEARYRIGIDDPNAEIDLSEQYVLSFAPSGCGFPATQIPDCSGGWLASALWLLEQGTWEHQGIGTVTENCVPYVDGGRSTGKTYCEQISVCKDPSEITYYVDSWQWIDTGAWNIKNYLYTVGPVMVWMPLYPDFKTAWRNATYWQYHFYDHERKVMDDGTDEKYVGHFVVIVGWDDQSPDTTEDDYWIVRNSWGPGGGDIYTGFSGGYFYMTQDWYRGFFGTRNEEGLYIREAAVINDVVTTSFSVEFSTPILSVGPTHYWTPSSISLQNMHIDGTAHGLVQLEDQADMISTATSFMYTVRPGRTLNILRTVWPSTS
jgi:hypothetical protein